MVLTSCPSAMTTSVVQDLTALPSRCTTQAPHCEVSQPTWVPVSRRFSRRNCTRSVRGSTLAFTGLPFTIREILANSTLFICAAALHGSTVIKNQAKPIIWAIPVMSNLARNMAYRVSAGLYRLGEIGEKLVGQFLGGAVDQALTELGELAADLRLDVIGQERAAVLFRQRHRGATLGEAGDAALAFARYPVAVGRIEIAQRHAPLEAGRHRADLHLW